MEATECGAASLAMIFAFYGRNVPIEKMRIETGVMRDGVNAANMMRAAKRNGLNCRAFRKEPEELQALKMPCIIHWNFCHFVVLEGFKNGYVYLNDPAIGRRKLTLDELDEGFTGVVMTFEKTEEFETLPSQNTLWEFIKSQLTGRYRVIFKIFYVGLLLVFPGLVLPVLSQVFMDDILGNGYTDWLIKLLTFFSLMILLKFGLSYYRQYLLQKFRNNLVIISGYKFLKHLFRLPIFFFDQRYAGDLSSRMEDSTEVNSFFAGELGETILNGFVALFYLIILFIYSPALTGVGIISVIISILIMIKSSKVIGDATMKLEVDSGKLYGVVCAGLSISSTLKAAGAEQAYTTRILGYQAKVSAQEQRISKIQEILDSIPDTINQVADVLILLIGGVMVMEGKFTIGMLIAFDSLFSSFYSPVEELIKFAKKIKILKTNLVRVNDIMRYRIDESFTDEKIKTIPQGKLKGNVQLKDITFGYNPFKPPLIRKFNLNVKRGESVAIIGASGCGKSTVSKMISGLYHPWEGSIQYDGSLMLDINRYIRNVSIATVSQNISMFAGTIKDNLRLWNPAILDKDIIAAAKDACIHDTIMSKSGGYDYILEEGASNLSGGQRQRLEIARALATNPSILIMDEATSALDPIVEKIVIDNIKNRGCTCIIVAHRLSAIRDCDEILVMDKGETIQRGRHDELIKSNGYYNSFIRNI
ncbi:MAG: NHLP family bacteriocin export ABC transporter peptidase/permease/ATPase subunit [Candidatus Delongbacteria bacterium]|nr:NHLP family bacteriocin export ABC transporter peptidase/permease/ATPase subunit [Candidatus Delongbacteria bacterium]